uniref:Uncharacterized protein n=1 Tax=Timema cristinae TaxID=61476 RepID=A0A7R9H398_TIMCR|nr:unnamed protein product [Timema cristinae]
MKKIQDTMLADTLQEEDRGCKIENKLNPAHWDVNNNNQYYVLSSALIINQRIELPSELGYRRDKHPHPGQSNPKRRMIPRSVSNDKRPPWIGDEVLPMKIRIYAREVIKALLVRHFHWMLHVGEYPGVEPRPAPSPRAVLLTHGKHVVQVDIVPGQFLPEITDHVGSDVGPAAHDETGQIPRAAGLLGAVKEQRPRLRLPIQHGGPASRHSSTALTIPSVILTRVLRVHPMRWFVAIRYPPRNITDQFLTLRVIGEDVREIHGYFRSVSGHGEHLPHTPYLGVTSVTTHPGSVEDGYSQYLGATSVTTHPGPV